MRRHLDNQMEEGNARSTHEDSKIIEAFVNGGITGNLLALTSRRNILDYLNGRAPSQKNLAAYAWIMYQRPNCNQYLECGSHFLVKNTGYTSVYCWMGGSLNHRVKSLSVRLRNILTIPHPFPKNFYKMTDVEKRRHVGEAIFWYPIGQDFDIDSNSTRESLIKVFRVDICGLRIGDIKVISERVNKIILSEDPAIIKAMSESLGMIIKSIYSVLDRSYVDWNALQTLLKIVPDPDLEKRISAFSSVSPSPNVPFFKDFGFYAYLLGFPVCDVSWTEKSLIPHLSEITMGREKISRRIADSHKREVRNLIDSIPEAALNRGSRTSEGNAERGSVSIDNVESLISNHTDSVAMSEVVLYSPFDVLRYVNSSGKVFQLVRSEFSYILEKRLNPWTSEILPVSVYMEVKKREEIALHLRLPKANPLMEIIDDVTRVDGDTDIFHPRPRQEKLTRQ